MRVANVQDGKLDLSTVKTVNIFDRELEKWKLERGDILLTEGGDWDKLGRGTVWNSELPMCIHQNHVFRLRVKDKSFDPNFIAVIIASPIGKLYFQSAAKKTTNLASINQRQLKAFRVPNISLILQIEILKKVKQHKSTILALDQLQTQSQLELDALPASILARAFAGEL